MKQIKQTYLVLLIVISLFSLAIYSTYAMFEAEINTNNIVSIDTSISMDTGIDEYQITTVEPNSYKILDISIQNTQDKDLYYGVWIEQISGNNQNIRAYRLDTAISSTVGIIYKNDTYKTTIVLINDNQKKSTIKLGIVTSEDSSLNLDENRILITEEISKDNIKNQTATDFIKSLYTEDSNQLYYDNDNLLYYGENPNNYLILNQELWRVIGIYDNQIKIIKNDSLGTYTYNLDNQENNNYENSKINTLLNELYSKSTKGSCYQKGEETECDFTSTGLTEDTLEKITNQTINNETVTIKEVAELSTAIPNTINSFQTVASLLSLTDYQKSFNCSEDTCKSWINKLDTLLLTQNSIDNIQNVITINNEEVKIDNNINADFEVRPVLLLKENNYIIKGSGTRDNPYVLD